MSVLFFWTGDNYYNDIASGKAHHLNQNNELMLNLTRGEHVWTFTRREDKTYVLASDLVVTGTKKNQAGDPGYEYGAYHVDGDRHKSRYFDISKNPDAETLIRSLSFSPSARILGHSFQGRNAVRLLTPADEQKLVSFSAGFLRI